MAKIRNNVTINMISYSKRIYYQRSCSVGMLRHNLNNTIIITIMSIRSFSSNNINKSYSIPDQYGYIVYIWLYVVFIFRFNGIMICISRQNR